jgi:YggT family protein
MVARLIYFVFNLYELGLIVYIICTWIAHPGAANIRRRLAGLYEPLLVPIRRVVPMIRLGYSMLDLSPIILFLAVAVLRSLLMGLFMPPF